MFVAVVAFAAVAIYLATKLYLTRDESISPAAPESDPAAQSIQRCDTFAVTFTLDEEEPPDLESETEAPTSEIGGPSTSTATATASPTPSPAPTGTQTSTPTPTQVAQVTTTPTLPPDVPVTGASLPVMLTLGLGAILIIMGAIALAL